MITGSITRGTTTWGGGLKLSPLGRLCYIGTPNSEENAWDEEGTWGESYPWGTWFLPDALYATMGECLFFNGSGVAQHVTGAAILADILGYNGAHVVFSQKHTWLAVYASTAPSWVIARANKLAE